MAKKEKLLRVRKLDIESEKGKRTWTIRYSQDLKKASETEKRCRE